MNEDYPDVLTTQQLAQILHVGINKIYELLKSNKIKSIRIGQQYRIPRKHLSNYLFNNNKI